MPRLIKISLLLSLWVFSQMAFARVPTEAEFSASREIADDVSDWYQNLPERPQSVTIFSTYSHEPLEQDYSAVLEAEVLKKLAGLGLEHVSSCSECRSPQIMIEGETLFIRKGIPDVETLKKFGEKHPVESFMVLEVYRTKFSILVHATLYKTATGAIIGTEKFSSSALTLNDAEVQLLLTFGAGKTIGVSQTGFNYAGNVMLVEELGFGKGGLSIGTVLGGSAGTLIYVNPTLAFYGTFGRRKVTWSTSLGAGFGLLGGVKGVTFRGAYEIFLGSTGIFGVDGIYMLPETTTTGSLSGYFGVHLGVAFGR